MSLLWTRLGKGIPSRPKYFKSNHLIDVQQSIILFLFSIHLLVKFSFSQALNDVASNAQSKQDNVLLEYPILLFSEFTFLPSLFYYYQRYECALIRNKIEGIPVLPIFLAEFDQNDSSKFVKFSRDINFPNSPHSRNPSAQSIIDGLWYVILLFFPFLFYYYQFVFSFL